MADNNKRSAKHKKNAKKKKISIFKLILIMILMVILIGVGAASGLIYATIKNAPDIDPTKALTLLTESSEILDKNGKLIEKIHTQEFRTKVELDQIPDDLEDAFIAIEDERFETHIGVDPKRIIGALVADIKAGSAVQGASTITQQLIKNLYLMEEVDKENLMNDISRKIKEAYLAIKLERSLTKDQILHAYLNTINLGQGAYGVQEAAQTYYSKDVEDLTLAESAMIAGITKSPTGRALYTRYKKENIDLNDPNIIRDENGNPVKIVIFKDIYIPVFNQTALERQRVILAKMKELEFISDTEYNEALSEDMFKAIKPGIKKNENIETSYFNDYIKERVIKDLMSTKGYTKEEATRELFTGGLKIYSTMDINLQSKVENIYNDFGKILAGDIANTKGAILVNRTLDSYNNIIDNKKNIALYKKSNLLNEEGKLTIENGTYKISEDGSIIIKNNKIYYRNLDIVGYYEIDEGKNLITHSRGSLNIPKESIDNENKQIVVSKSFLNENSDFYSIDENSNLLISHKYFYIYEGVVQPQSSMVIMDYSSGEIKALVGGRNLKGNKLFNRATDAPRQPGSSIKPLSVYLPALDNNFTASTVIDDIPHYNRKGEIWPKNWYGELNSAQKANKADDYRGLVTLREAVELSVNVASVKVLERIGIDTSVEYLTRLGIIDSENPENDNFITKAESSNSDEDYAPLGLGGMNHGITPLDMTAAYGAIANRGIYTEPIAYTKVLDSNDNIILENKPLKNTVVTPQVSYLMTDILKSTITNGTGKRAQLYQYNTKIPVAGKTGTTQKKVDAWFVGYTPYYVAGVWIGNDNQAVKLASGSKYAAILWGAIMKDVHEGLPDKDFEKPQGYVTKKICTESGKLATELCERDPRGSTVRTEIFLQGTEPRDFCDTHVEVAIDTSTGKLANEYCPPELIENKVFIRRNPPYNPDEHEGYIPMDYIYTVPTEVCDEHSESNIFDNFFDNLFNNNDDDRDEDLEDDSINENEEGENDSDNVVDSLDD